MPTPRQLPAALGAEFSVAEGLAAGATPRRLRALDLESPFHGVRRSAAVRGDDGPAGDDDEPLGLDRRRRLILLRDARAYAPVMPSGAFFCGRTAACIHGAPVDPGGALEVAVFAPRRAPRARGVRGRKVAAHLAEVVSAEGLPVTAPATTWAMLGRDLSERDLVVIGDAFVRIPRDRYGRQHPESALTTAPLLRAAVDAGARPPATGRLRAALDLIRVGSSSPLETEFRLDAEATGLPAPTLDLEIRDERGRLLGISEFAFPAFRAVVEIEGDHHRTSRAQWHRDIEKYRAYEEAEWHVVRLTSTHVRDSRLGLSLVASALARRGWAGFRS